MGWPLYELGVVGFGSPPSLLPYKSVEMTSSLAKPHHNIITLRSLSSIELADGGKERGGGLRVEMVKGTLLNKKTKKNVWKNKSFI